MREALLICALMLAVPTALAGPITGTFPCVGPDRDCPVPEVCPNGSGLDDCLGLQGVIRVVVCFVNPDAPDCPNGSTNFLPECDDGSRRIGCARDHVPYLP